MSLLAASTETPRPAATTPATADRGARPPAVLLISISGAMVLLALGAAWLWVKHGATILLDIGQVFCF